MADDKKKKTQEVDLSGADAIYNDEVPLDSEESESKEEIPLSDVLVEKFVHGFTNSGGDELQAGFQAGANKLAGEKESLNDLYNKFHNIEKERLAQMDKESPWGSNLAEIAGSWVSPFPKLAALGKAGKYVAGGAMGAIQGFNASDGSIMENPKELALDTLTGASLGVGIPAAVDTLGFLGKKVIDTDLGKKAYDYARKGYEYVGTEGKTAISNLADTKLGKIVNKLVRDNNLAAETEQKLIDEASGAGKKINVSQTRKSFENAIENAPEAFYSPKDKERLMNHLSDKMGDGYQSVARSNVAEELIPAQKGAMDEMKEYLAKLRAKDEVLGDQGEDFITKKTVGDQDYLVGGFKKTDVQPKAEIVNPIMNEAGEVVDQSLEQVGNAYNDTLSNLKVIKDRPAIPESIKRIETYTPEIDQIKNENLSPRELYSLYKQMSDDPKSFKQLLNDNPKLVDQLRNNLRDIPEVSDQMDLIRKQLNLQEKLNLRKAGSNDYLTPENIQEMEKAKMRLNQFIEKSGVPDTDQKMVQNMLDDASQDLEKLDPALGNEFVKTRKELTDLQELNRATGGNIGLVPTSPKEAVRNPGFLTKNTVRVANAVGKGVRAAGEGVRSVAESKIVRKLSEETPEGLKSLAMALPQKYSSYKALLEKAAMAPGGARDAILFQLMQQDTFRQEVKRLKDGEEIDLSGVEEEFGE